MEGSSQQKILVLLDGHRLNSRAYSEANFDYGISLDKVKQIEVLRGPGSSLYGNVALTAVVNLVTLSGKDVDGVRLRVGGGNHGQATGSLMGGSALGKDGEVLFWANGFEAAGEKVAIDASQDLASQPRSGTALVGAVRSPSSYDLGLKYLHGGLRLMASRRLGQMVEPFTSSGLTGEVFDYNAVDKYLGHGPGLSSLSNHLEAAYDRALTERLELSASINYDTNELRTVVVAAPATGAGSMISWDDDALGVNAHLRYSYQAGRAGAGSATVGGQIERMRLLDSSLSRSAGGVWTDLGADPTVSLMQPGREITYSGFAQLKHRLSDFIVNLGLRYDLKDRHKGADVSDLSPRLAFIYMPSKDFDVKLSFAQSFVDAPYWYRYNSFPSYRGGENLTPEHLRAFQLTPTLALLGGELVLSANLFYKHIYDVVFRNNSAGPDEPIYQNAGTLRSLGAEAEVALLQERWRVRGNFTWQHALEARDFGASDGEIFNVPSLVANLVAEVSPVPSLRKLWLSGTVHFNGSQLSPITTRVVDASGNVVADYSDPDHRVAAYALLDLGVRWNDLVFEGLGAEATVRNVFDQRTYQGGSVAHPYPQPGRWVLASLSYKLPF